MLDVFSALTEAAADSSHAPCSGSSKIVVLLRRALDSALKSHNDGSPWEALVANGVTLSASGSFEADLETVSRFGSPASQRGACPPIIVQSRL